MQIVIVLTLFICISVWRENSNQIIVIIYQLCGNQNSSFFFKLMIIFAIQKSKALNVYYNNTMRSGNFFIAFLIMIVLQNGYNFSSKFGTFNILASLISPNHVKLGISLNFDGFGPPKHHVPSICYPLWVPHPCTSGQKTLLS